MYKSKSEILKVQI